MNVGGKHLPVSFSLLMIMTDSTDGTLGKERKNTYLQLTVCAVSNLKVAFKQLFNTNELNYNWDSASSSYIGGKRCEAPTKG